MMFLKLAKSKLIKQHLQTIKVNVPVVDTALVVDTYIEKIN